MMLYGGSTDLGIGSSGALDACHFVRDERRVAVEPNLSIRFLPSLTILIT